MSSVALVRHGYRLEFVTADGPTGYPGDWVAPAYLKPAREQAIFAAQCAGVVGRDTAAVPIAEQPVFDAEGSPEITGIVFHAGHPPNCRSVFFGIRELFSMAAGAQLARLIATRSVPRQENVSFRVHAEPREIPPVHPAGAAVRRKSLPLRPGQLSAWRDAARTVGSVDDARHYPLLIASDTLDAVHQRLFSGERQEGAALLVGHLYQQVEPEPLIFGVADAVIDIRHAECSPLSIRPTAEMYADLNAQLTRRRTRLGRPDEAPLVLVHNHPFVPSVHEDGETGCPACPKRATCTLTSAFYSSEDVDFHLSLFAAQPYVTGLVIGLTPREEHDLRLFAMHGCQPCPRGYDLFDPQRQVALGKRDLPSPRRN